MHLPSSNRQPSASRRAFVKTACCSAVLASLGLTVGCDGGAEGGAAEPPPPGSGITLGSNTITLDLTGTQASKVAVAGGVLFIPQAQAMVVNDAGTLRAFASVCTHEACDITRFAEARFTCPCHGSQFDAQGRVTRGPATRNLTAFAVERAGNTVTITKA